MADNKRIGTQVSDAGKHATEQGFNGGREKVGYPLYPPGPGDREGWSQLLSIVPEAEPTFCRTLNGPATGVDLRLRAVGNGVVPAVAAVAFRELANKLKKDGNFPNILYDDRTLAKRCEINHGGQ